MVCYYDGWKIIETRDGSANLYQQFIHGTQYIDEIVMARIADKGEAFVHQDANWNVIALTDMGGHMLERYEYTLYGQFTAHEVTGYGDRDGDGVVNSTDKGTPGTTCSGTVTGACRILDLDFDGDYDAADGTLFDALDQGLARHPGLLATGLHFPFADQGLYYDPELGSYQNRNRQYDPKLRRFMQRDIEALRAGQSLYGAHPGRPLPAQGLLEIADKNEDPVDPTSPTLPAPLPYLPWPSVDDMFNRFWERFITPLYPHAQCDLDGDGVDDPNTQLFQCRYGECDGVTIQRRGCCPWRPFGPHPVFDCHFELWEGCDKPTPQYECVYDPPV